LKVNQHIKKILGLLLYWTGIYRILWRDRAIVVAFHRVDDAYAGDPLTCTRAEFADYCGFFAKHWIVVSLSELVHKLRTGQDISRHLAITFDDGYRDNYLAAAKELKRRGLPATFFVTTNFIGSNHVPWWDAAQNITPTWMSWDEVRELHRLGFEIAPHTENHVDLGVVQADEARREIAGSRERLCSELGVESRLFSYPYGRDSQISKENRDLVRELGFHCCASAYGGVVTSKTDPMRMQRMPIGPWYASPYEFGFQSLRSLRQ
jgi:peptidoglycan/xylan/chitin deacetylase (PgdA/CDA1 family)